MGMVAITLISLAVELGLVAFQDWMSDKRSTIENDVQQQLNAINELYSQARSKGEETLDKLTSKLSSLSFVTQSPVLRNAVSKQRSKIRKSISSVNRKLNEMAFRNELDNQRLGRLAEKSSDISVMTGQMKKKADVIKQDIQGGKNYYVQQKQDFSKAETKV